jgi:hypothetical protein
MGTLNLLVARLPEDSGWRIVVTITPRAPVKVGEMVAYAMTEQEAAFLIEGLMRAVQDAHTRGLAERN